LIAWDLPGLDSSNGFGREWLGLVVYQALLSHEVVFQRIQSITLEGYKISLIHLL
jgi:hypothetical protein